jgi:hypothetical protein
VKCGSCGDCFSRRGAGKVLIKETIPPGFCIREKNAMSWIIRACLAVAMVALFGGPASAADDKPVRALFVLVGAGGHNVEFNTPPLFQTIEKVGGIQATLLAPPKGKPGDGAHLARLADVKKSTMACWTSTPSATS